MTKFNFFNLLKYASSAAVLLFFSGCPQQTQERSSAGLSVCCGLPPIAFIAEEIGKDRVNVQCLLPYGRSPHDYSPRPQEIYRAGKSKIFFTTGMAFEKSASQPLQGKVDIVDVGKNIIRRHFDSNHKCSGHHHHHHDDTSLDPHIWLSADNALAIAKNIASAYTKADPDNKEFYRSNLDSFAARLAVIKSDTAKLLAPHKGKEFFVYHPAFGYFADSVGMTQTPVEINGREATAQQLAAIIRNARSKGIKTIFVQPQFNPKTAEVLAQQLEGTAVHLDPLAHDLLENLRAIPAAINRGFGKDK